MHTTGRLQADLESAPYVGQILPSELATPLAPKTAEALRADKADSSRRAEASIQSHRTQHSILGLPKSKLVLPASAPYLTSKLLARGSTTRVWSDCMWTQ